MTELDTYLAHIGVERRSGRYPWGSGENPNQRGNKDFLAIVDELKKKGMRDPEIATSLGMNTTQLRAAKAIAKNEKRQADATRAYQLKQQGMSNVAIAKEMGRNESSIRALLNPAMQERNDVLTTTANMLKDQVAAKGMIDIGVGNENQLGISGTKLKTAVAMLEDEGYRVHNVQVPQLTGGGNQKSTIKVLAPPGTEYPDIVSDLSQIKTIQDYSEDGGRSWLGLETPQSVSSNRIGIRYAEQGGADMDGVIQLRRGVDDISLGNARYAQVRIAVDGTHYLKGMAMYADDLPPGVDMVFNTNKKNSGNKLDAMKPMKADEDNPFGSVVRQKHYTDKDGKRKLSALNIVGTEDPDGKKTPGEEGGWSAWSNKLSSQMLSKQSPTLAKEQLDLTYQLKKAEYDEIMALTNPVVKKKLLESFADGADSSAVHLKAAGLPRTANHVILPINSLKDNEIYAPWYRDGERVVLIRHPHGGTFEIPELTVNNRNKEANSVIRNARDAVGINSKVAGRLSGADFDGDTVLVIPNNSRKVKNSSPLEKLKDFDPKEAYRPYDGMRTMDGGTYIAATGKVDYHGGKPNSRIKQMEMGKASNLITDMTIKGASHAELARAVAHSMVVIDAEKHSLNYKQSYKDNGIAQLKERYQGRGETGKLKGASTLISRASSDARIPVRKLRSAADGGPVDPKTGKLVYVETGEGYTTKNGKFTPRLMKAPRMSLTDDAHTLSSGTVMETVYADHANRLKALANSSRKTALATKPTPYSPEAKKVYDSQVKTLNAKLNVALKNKPLERQAQVVANTTVSAKLKSNPDMSSEELKKIKNQALTEARLRVGAKKNRVDITDGEWEAIQAGAISPNKLRTILDNTDLDLVKQLATPRTNTVISPALMTRAKSMRNSGYTPAEIAEQLGIATSTLSDAFTREES